MAKYERRLYGKFSDVLFMCDNAIISASASASVEEKSDFTVGNVRVSVRVYERYSTFGANRVSLNLTLAGEGNDLFLSAITSGGSQAVLFKLNTVGEKAFLNTLIRAVESRYPLK